MLRYLLLELLNLEIGRMPSRNGTGLLLLTFATSKFRRLRCGNNAVVKILKFVKNARAHVF